MLTHILLLCGSLVKQCKGGRCWVPCRRMPHKDNGIIIKEIMSGPGDPWRVFPCLLRGACRGDPEWENGWIEGWRDGWMGVPVYLNITCRRSSTLLPSHYFCLFPRISHWRTVRWHCQLSFPKAQGASPATCLLRQTGGGASGVEIPCKELP